MNALYLSRLTLPLQDRSTQRRLGDCHAMHRFVMSGFPDIDGECARNGLGVLYRVEERRAHSDVHVLVQSTAAPRWVFESSDIAVSGPATLGPLLRRIVPGERFRFRLRANPTRRVHARATEGADPSRGRARPEDAKSAGKRVAVRGDEARLAWLQRKADASGFALAAATVTPGLESMRHAYEGFSAMRADPSGRLMGRARVAPDAHSSERRRLTFETCLFEGMLTVTDAGALHAAMMAGIGPGKAFGCGLLSLAPAG